MTRPYMEVIWIEGERRITIPIVSRWHLELHIFVRDVLLLIVHSEQQTDGSIDQPNHHASRPGIQTVREGEDGQMMDDNIKPKTPTS